MPVMILQLTLQVMKCSLTKIYIPHPTPLSGSLTPLKPYPSLFQLLQLTFLQRLICATLRSAARTPVAGGREPGQQPLWPPGGSTGVQVGGRRSFRKIKRMLKQMMPLMLVMMMIIVIMVIILLI